MGDSGTMNGLVSLPSKDSEDVHLVEATPEEFIDLTKANSSEWRGALPTLDLYLRREKHLASQELTKDGGMTSWVLVYQPKDSTERRVLCGCDSIKKKALVGRNGEVEEVVAHGVCSVFCPPQNRGKGYAGRMMTELGKRLEGWQVKDGNKALFSVLFSDIGKEFYAARNWHPFASAHLSLKATPKTGDGLPAVRLLKSADLPELCTLDEQILRRRLSKDSAMTAVALLPDHRTLAWHHAREEFVGKELFNKSPEIKGAIVGEPGSRVWCYWTRMWTGPQEESPNTLHVMRLAIEDETFSDFAAASSDGAGEGGNSATAKAIAALFAAAQSQAAECGMEEVMMWNPTSTTLAAAQLLEPHVAVEHRQKGSIASLRWYGEGSWQNVDWVCNEKYGWA